MKRILIVYGTTDGHTGKIAEFVAGTLRGMSVQADVVNAGSALVDPDPARYDATIVAASLHAGGYQRKVRCWLVKHSFALDLRPTAFLSVCLGVLERNPETDRNLANITDRLFETTGWRPTVLKFVAGALPYTKYSWLKRRVMRRIVRKAHGDIDTSRDYEYTDWEELGSVIRGFYFANVAPVALAG